MVHSQRVWSDIDLAVIGTIKPPALSAQIADAEHRILRPINITHYSAADFKESLAAKRHFVTSLLHTPKEFIIGSQDVLTSIAGEQQASNSHYVEAGVG